ncbi:uncharacterized protein LOC119574049 [Penaeus monodon]|uniref:uncharacterized protein LOC119574049 n=1 Tax=Penaeus monodon TaxID=6687 RepID=UPI0018A774AD|nr:uncharacterized protein LOC119574049 [Penaeus monodon]
MEKYREGQKELHCVFIDLEKAYDRVPREKVWICLRLKGYKKVCEIHARYVQRSIRTIQEDAGSDKEVQKRIQAGWNSWRKVTGIVCNRQVTEKSKRQDSQCDGETSNVVWTGCNIFAKAQERKLEVTEMKMLRWGLGLTRRDLIRNEVVLKKVGVNGLHDQLRESRLRWRGHVMRKEMGSVGRRVERMKVGKAKRGRRRRRMPNCYNEDMKEVGIEDTDAQNRQLWRRRIAPQPYTAVGSVC